MGDCDGPFLCQLSTSYSPLGGEDLKGENIPTRLAYGQVGAFS